MLQAQERQAEVPEENTEWPQAPEDRKPLHAAAISSPLVDRARRVRGEKRESLELTDISMARDELAMLEQSETEQGVGEGPGEKVKGIILRRLKAMNPIRDFKKLGVGGLMKCDLWEDYRDMAIDWGIWSVMITTMVVVFCTDNLRLALGAGVFAAAPLFITSFAIRTAFNLVAGVSTLVAAPVVYAAAELNQARESAGQKRARTFLADLKRAKIEDFRKAEIKRERIEMLQAIVEEAEEGKASPA